VSSHSGSGSENDKECYSASYLAMDARQRQPSNVPSQVRRPRGRVRLLFLLLILGTLAYVQRARIFSWMESVPGGATLVQEIRSRWAPEDSGGLPGVAGSWNATGTTFSSGQGFGTVMPDDGADTFRVVPAPQEESGER